MFDTLSSCEFVGALLKSGSVVLSRLVHDDQFFSVNIYKIGN